MLGEGGRSASWLAGGELRRAGSSAGPAAAGGAGSGAAASAPKASLSCFTRRSTLSAGDGGGRGEPLSQATPNPPAHGRFTHHSTRLSWVCGRCRAWATVGPAPGRCSPAARRGWAAGCSPGSSPPAERAAVVAAGRSHAGGSGGGRAPTSMGVRRMPAVGERGSLT